MEIVEKDESGEERKAGEQVSRSATGNLANLFMAGAMDSKAGMKPMEFSVLYLI